MHIFLHYFFFSILGTKKEAKEVKAVLKKTKKRIHKAKVHKTCAILFACYRHAISVTSYKRNEVERNMRWATVLATSVRKARYFFGTPSLLLPLPKSTGLS